MCIRTVNIQLFTLISVVHEVLNRCENLKIHYYYRLALKKKRSYTSALVLWDLLNKLR